jgi:DNA-binding XRE family transcriptional regulator
MTMPKKKSSSKPKPAAKQETGGGRSAASCSPFQVNLKRMIREKGLTQCDLQQASGIRQGSISNYLNGKRDPSAAQLKRLADSLGVTMDALYAESAGLCDRDRS